MSSIVFDPEVLMNKLSSHYQEQSEVPAESSALSVQTKPASWQPWHEAQWFLEWERLAKRSY